MEITSEHLSIIGGVVTTLVVQTFALVKYLVGQQREQIKSLSDQFSNALSELRSEVAGHVLDYKRGHSQVNVRINDVKDNYVKREDHDKDFAHMQVSLREFRTDVKTDLTNMHALCNQGFRELQKEITALIKDRK